MRQYFILCSVQTLVCGGATKETWTESKTVAGINTGIMVAIDRNRCILSP